MQPKVRGISSPQGEQTSLVSYSCPILWLKSLQRGNTIEIHVYFERIKHLLLLLLLLLLLFELKSFWLLHHVNTVIETNGTYHLSQLQLQLLSHRMIGNRGGSRIPCRRGCRPSRGHQHTILSNFPKNCMKSRKFWAVGGRALGAPPWIRHLGMIPTRQFETLPFISALLGKVNAQTHKHQSHTRT